MLLQQCRRSLSRGRLDCCSRLALLLPLPLLPLLSLLLRLLLVLLDASSQLRMFGLEVRDHVPVPPASVELGIARRAAVL
jgi:hypothetical protein